jgi:hypothetical protein
LGSDTLQVFFIGGAESAPPGFDVILKGQA